MPKNLNSNVSKTAALRNRRRIKEQTTFNRFIFDVYMLEKELSKADKKIALVIACLLRGMSLSMATPCLEDDIRKYLDSEKYDKEQLDAVIKLYADIVRLAVRLRYMKANQTRQRFF